MCYKGTVYCCYEILLKQIALDIFALLYDLCGCLIFCAGCTFQPARVALKAGCEGVSAINTIMSVMGIDLNTLRPEPSVEGSAALAQTAPCFI